MFVFGRAFGIVEGDRADLIGKLIDIFWIRQM